MIGDELGVEQHVTVDEHQVLGIRRRDGEVP
jgi:hypothetical protein